MKISLNSTSILKKVRCKNDVKYKYTIETETGVKYCILKWTDSPYILYDYEFDDELSKYNWSYHSPTGYVYTHFNDENHTRLYMHSLITKLAKIDNYDNENLSVDHIVYSNKTDNRVCNLRMATQSTQNSNRGTRSDKKKPCQELLDIGINELPRFVRWDKSEGKFIIEKHPALLKEVEQGIRKKPVMSCAKGNKTIKEKYDDAISRLDILNKSSIVIKENIAFKEFQNKLQNEYANICCFIESVFVTE